jgi:hypothetical protein
MKVMFLFRSSLFPMSYGINPCLGIHIKLKVRGEIVLGIKKS